MAYQMVATAVTLNDLKGHSPVADVFTCNPSNICATFYTISTDSVLAWFLWISRASCQQLSQNTAIIVQLTQRVARFLCNSRTSCQITLTADHVAEYGLVPFSELREQLTKKEERKKEEPLVKYICPPTYYVGRPIINPNVNLKNFDHSFIRWKYIQSVPSVRRRVPSRSETCRTL